MKLRRWKTFSISINMSWSFAKNMDTPSEILTGTSPNGRPLRDTATPDDREYWTDIWVQSFCLTPGKQRWFPVYVDQEPLPPDERRSAEIQAILDEIKREYAVYQAKQSCWLKRTGWILHLWESNLEHLAHAARLPGKDDPELEVIADAVEDLIEDCVKGLASLPLDIRRWLRSDHPTEMHPRPMGRLTNRIVHYKYREHL
ncbi:hypothetical protein E4U35_006451 [Claviceps purpurea]|nr:hypothetical protein E4U35_006451 [Claviceps purpurea]